MRRSPEPEVALLGVRLPLDIREAGFSGLMYTGGHGFLRPNRRSCEQAGDTLSGAL
jgi:hypothetical protein